MVRLLNVQLKQRLQKLFCISWLCKVRLCQRCNFSGHQYCRLCERTLWPRVFVQHEDRAPPEAAVVLWAPPGTWRQAWDHHLSLTHGPDGGLHPVQPRYRHTHTEMLFSASFLTYLLHLYYSSSMLYLCLWFKAGLIKKTKGRLRFRFIDFFFIESHTEIIFTSIYIVLLV